MHPILTALEAAAEGRFPLPDGTVRVCAPLEGGHQAVVAFTAHTLIATSRDHATLIEHGADAYGGALAPAVLTLLAGDDGAIGVTDATLVARGTGAGGPPPRTDLDAHPRVRHARAIRRDVRVHGDARGLVTLSCGLAGRLELSVEVESGRCGLGDGHSLVRDALGLVPTGVSVFAAVSPGNARSLRLFLGLGFVPLAAECLITPGTAAP